MTHATAIVPDGARATGFGGLEGHKYCRLVTFRRSGAAVATPVWFAIDGDRLVVKTEDPSGKVKRIRATSRVEVAPCTLRGRPLGPPRGGRARILPSAEEAWAEVERPRSLRGHPRRHVR